MKKHFFAAVMAAFCGFAGFSQGITTANEFFKEVSDKYASFKDYSATVDITVDKKDMSATVLYLAPDKMRMDFSEPASQTIVYDGKKLICYLPENTSVLTQESANTNPATAEGLSLLRRYYSVSYEESHTGRDRVRGYRRPCERSEQRGRPG